MERRFLVYKSWNGQIHSEIQYGETGTSLEVSISKEVQRIELLDHTLTLHQAVGMYPYGQEVIRR